MKKSLKSLIAILLAVTLTLSTAPVFAAGFTDTAGHWAESEIDKWNALGLVQGSGGSFNPDGYITRGEMAQLAANLMKYRVSAVNTFYDLGYEWYRDAILKANAAGVMLGSGGYVRPRDNITRQEAAALICRLLNIDEVSGSAGFADDASIASWASPSVNALKRRGFISGVGNNLFAPNSYITRAALVKLLDNAVSGVYNTAGVYSNSGLSGVTVINASGVTLRNMTISGDLIIAEGVGDGSVSLENVTITGAVTVKGGGRRTVELSNCSIPTLDVDRAEAEVRLTATGTTRVSNTYIRTTATLEHLTGLTGSGFGNVTASGLTGLRLDMTGRFGNLTADTANADIRVDGSVADIIVNKYCKFSGDFSFTALDIAYGAGCTINGETVNGGVTGLVSLSITTSSGDTSAKVGDTLTAAAVTSGTVPLTYQWYWSSTNLAVSSSSWNRITGATSKTYALTSTMQGRYLMVEVTSSSTASTLRAKLSSSVGSGTTNSFTAVVENYTNQTSTKNEASVRFVFSQPLAFLEGGTYTAVENNYDFKYSAQTWFAVRVNNSSASEDDSMIASAVYSSDDNSITLTLSGDAALAKNRVSVTLKNTMYSTVGNTLLAGNAPVALRTASCATWQNSASPDTVAPTVSVPSAGSSHNVLRLVFSEPLGYYVNNVYRPVPNSYDLKNSAGSAGMFALKVNGATSVTASVVSAVYSSADYSVTVTLDQLGAEAYATLAPIVSFYDLYGNALTPTNAGVFYRRANELSWGRASNQSDADTLASAKELTGAPSFTSGGAARFGTQMTVGAGSLNVNAGLTYTWYRCNSAGYTSDAVLLTTGTTYTPALADIGKYIVVVAVSSLISGSREIASDQVKGKSPTVTGNTVTVDIGNGYISLAGVDGLFTVDTDGARTYTLIDPAPDPSDLSIITPSIDNNVLNLNSPYTFTSPLVCTIKLTTAASTTYDALSDGVIATLKVIKTAPRDLTLTAKDWTGTGTAIYNGIPGEILFDATTIAADVGVGNSLYIKNTPAPAGTIQGEIMGKGDLFSSTGYTLSPIEGNMGFYLPNAVSGTYYLVVTDASNKVVKTGIITLTDKNILARINVTNSTSAASIGFSVDGGDYSGALGTSTAWNTCVPRSSKKIVFTAIIDSTTKTVTVDLTFTGSSMNITLTDTMFK